MGWRGRAEDTGEAKQAEAEEEADSGRVEKEGNEGREETVEADSALSEDCEEEAADSMAWTRPTAWTRRIEEWIRGRVEWSGYGHWTQPQLASLPPPRAQWIGYV